MLATLPDNYSADWLMDVNKRRKIVRPILARIFELAVDSGGPTISPP